MEIKWLIWDGKNRKIKKKIEFIVPRAAGQDSKPPTETGLQSNQL